MKTTFNKRIISAVAVALALLVFGAFFLVKNNKEVKKESAQKIKMTVFRTPNCRCCLGYADEMKKQGFDVEIIATNNINKIKAKYNIPMDRQSCHTAIVGGYFIEGHVPVVAVKKLLKEKPNIAGIGLPGMPIGTPGMPGVKTESYRVYQSKNGEFSEYITL